MLYGKRCVFLVSASPSGSKTVEQHDRFRVLVRKPILLPVPLAQGQRAIDFWLLRLYRLVHMGVLSSRLIVWRRANPTLNRTAAGALVLSSKPCVRRCRLLWC